MNEYILWFQITMHDVMFVQYSEGFNNLCEICQGCLFWQCSLLFQEFFQGATVTELIDEVKVINSFQHVEVFDDVRACFQISQNADLVVSSFLEFRVLFEFFGFDHFDGDLLLGLDIDSPVDCGVSSSSDLVLQRVVLNHLPHFSPKNQL